MRNYIIINGVSSTTLKGFAIKTLPPITKPAMRNYAETIDGRDGDIITKLGYSSYIKEMEIGLYDGYEIDKIIKYFNSSGTIEFSNEVNKVYKFDMLEQIDFESLLKFRTALVSFYVQPFKYPSTENPYIIQTNDVTTINNIGNIYSRPKIKIEGNGTIDVYLNGTQIFSVELDNETIEIDSDLLEAYDPSTGNLMNRNVTGNIDNLKFDSGSNTIKFTGTLTKATISNYTRWL